MTGMITKQQKSEPKLLQDAATGNGNGFTVQVAGYGIVYVQVDNPDAAGVGTLALEGSFDGTNWFAIGYMHRDSQASPARSVTAISVAASSHTLYKLDDYVPMLRGVLSSVSGFTTGGITVTAHGVPVN